jgi:uronate dehydrogenase
MSGMTVLVTGSRGSIGRVVTEALRSRGHRVRGFDRGEPAHADDQRGDLLDEAAVRAAARGAQAIVHLGATPDEADFVTDLLPNNIVGTYRVLEAAVAESVPRVVLASTLRAMSGSWGGHARPIPSDVPPRPHDFYSWTKAGAELMGDMYARKRRLSVIAARIGMFTRNRDEWALVESWDDRSSYLSWRDARHFFVRAVEAERAPGYLALYAVGRDGIGIFDLETARHEIGYEPADAWPQGTPEISGWRMADG